MLGDDAQSKAIKITYKGADITAKIIGELIRKYISQSEQQSFGKQSLTKLNHKGKVLDSIPIMNKELRGLQKELKKFGVDYSVRKSLSENGIYNIYFKGSDISQIQTALKNYITLDLRKNQKRENPSIKERMKSAIQKAKDHKANLKQHEKKFERGRPER